MSNISFRLLVTGILIFPVCFTYGQGCSDAGFCTMNSFKPGTIDSMDAFSASGNQFKIGVSYGSADNSISVIGSYLEYNRQLNDKLSIDVKITSLSQSGNDISVSGLSDIYLNANYRLRKQIRLTAGVKIPLTDGNREKNKLALPMGYQSSLGTLDVIFGMSYEINKFQFVFALQQPLTQNKNEFIPENYPADSKLREFISTNKFKRNGDILLRVSCPVKLSKKLNMTLSVLPIYHLGNDKYTDLSGVEKEIKGSQGLTLNGNIYLDYQLSSRSTLQLSLGAPFIAREARPDGLTRHFVANLEYKIRF